MAYETPLTIADVINDISVNKYVLPSIQREYVWSTEQIERLFDSIMQDYPIGAFLFWELMDNQNTLYDFYSFLRNYHQKNATHNPKIDLKGMNNSVAVLDGQQRLTSIYIGLKGTYAYKLPRLQWKNDAAFPKRKLYLNIIEECQTGNNKYEFSFLTDEEKINDENHFWFLVGDIISMKELGDISEYIMENIAFSDYTKEQSKFANKTLSQLYKVIHTQPTISYYKVKADELDKVLNIFIRVNSGGTILSYSDLLLSVATAQWEELDAREEITECVDTINSIGGGFSVNKDFVLKSCLVLSNFSDIAFKVDNFNKPNMLKIEQNWSTIKKALYKSFELISSFGYNGERLKSNNAIIPIAYYLMQIGMPENFATASSHRQNREKIKKWLIMSLLKQAFSGAPDNVLRPIRSVLQKNKNKDFPISEIVERLRGTNKSIIFTDDDIENLLDRKYGKAETYSILMLLYPSLDFNNLFHMDHMYPKSKFTKHQLLKKGVDESKIGEYIEHINDLANLQLLAAIPNIEKQNTDFDKWFNENYQSVNDKINYKTINYLPEMEYTYSKFLDFISKRREMLKTELEKILM